MTILGSEWFVEVITSKLTSKAQTTIPQPIRLALPLKGGDEIAYRIEWETVILTRAPADSAEDPFVAISEWGSEADRRADADL